MKGENMGFYFRNISSYQNNLIFDNLCKNKKKQFKVNRVKTQKIQIEIKFLKAI